MKPSVLNSLSRRIFTVKVTACYVRSFYYNLTFRKWWHYYAIFFQYEVGTEIVVFQLILLSLTCNLRITYKFAKMFLSYRTFDIQEFLFSTHASNSGFGAGPPPSNMHRKRRWICLCPQVALINQLTF